MSFSSRSKEDKAFPALVLAAGASRRMGRYKALLPLGDGTLLDRAIMQARQLSAAVTVVTGAGYPLIRYRCRRQPSDWLPIADWEQGMSTSLQAGLMSLSPEAKGVFVVLLDQPLIETADLAQLATEARQFPWQPVAADMHGSPGAPAYLPRHIWPDIFQLEGDRGASGILADYGAETLPIPGALTDVDTPQDWQSIQTDYRNRFLRD